MGLNFLVLNVDSGNKLLPGAPNVSPVQGHIKALSRQTLTVKYLPGVPEKFEKTFQVKTSLLKTLFFFDTLYWRAYSGFCVVKKGSDTSKYEISKVEKN